MHGASGTWIDVVSTVANLVLAPAVLWSLAAVIVTALASAAALWTVASSRKRLVPVKVIKVPAKRT